MLRLRKFINGWKEAIRYYLESDKGRRKITKGYNKRFDKLANEGYAKRESDDFTTKLEGIRTCIDLWEETAEYDRMISRVAKIEFWDEARKELLKKFEKMDEETKKKP